MYLSCLSCCLSNIYIIFYSFFHILDLWSFFLVSKKNQNRTLWVQFSRLLSRFSLSQNGPNGRLRAQEILTEISICSQRIDSKKTVLRLDLKVSCNGWCFVLSRFCLSSETQNLITELQTIFAFDRCSFWESSLLYVTGSDFTRELIPAIFANQFSVVENWFSILLAFIEI